MNTEHERQQQQRQRQDSCNSKTKSLTTNTIATTTEEGTSYVLATDDDNNNNHNNNNNNKNDDDMLSLQSEKSFSTTDGIDILGAPPPTNFIEWNQSWAGRIVRDKRFKRAVVALILLNSILMGIATFPFVTTDPNVGFLFDVVDALFLLLFTLEIVLQVVHYRGRQVLMQGWLVFDIMIVSLSWFFSTLLVVRAFRIVRTLRLATRIQELQHLAVTILRVLPKLFACFFFFMLLFYIFAVLFTDLFHDLYESGATSEDYFSRLDITAFTLFSIMTLDDWSAVAREVMDVYRWAWMPFLAFITISVVVFFQLLMVVACQAVMAIQEERAVRLVKETPSTPRNNNNASSSSSSLSLEQLERKIDFLTATMDLLVQRQISLQDMLRQSQQEQQTYTKVDESLTEK